MTSVVVACDPGVGHVQLARDDVRAILISSALKHFCAGADIREMAALTAQEARSAGFIGCVSALPRLTKPVVVAVKGQAVLRPRSTRRRCNCRRGWNWSARSSMRAFLSMISEEGLAALLEKRKPHFLHR